MWPKELFYFHSSLHHSCRLGVNWPEAEGFQWGLIFSCIHVVAIYTSPPLTAEQSWVAYVTDIRKKAPCRQTQKAVGSSQAASSQARPWLYNSLQHTIPATESNGGYQTFHLLCISFLAVLLLEEARHWSHLRGTSVELFHLNYSSYMRPISF